MPLYDYDCAACGGRFEVIHGVHGEPPSSCPLCGGGPVKKAFAAPAIHFKGSGWAKKERRAGTKAGANAPDGAASESASGASGADGATSSPETTAASPKDSVTPGVPKDSTGSTTATATTRDRSTAATNPRGTGD